MDNSFVIVDMSKPLCMLLIGFVGSARLAQLHLIRCPALGLSAGHAGSSLLSLGSAFANILLFSRVGVMGIGRKEVEGRNVSQAVHGRKGIC